MAWGVTPRIRAASDCEIHFPEAKSFLDKVVEVFNPFVLCSNVEWLAFRVVDRFNLFRILKLAATPRD
jgi:hypothetical protein